MFWRIGDGSLPGKSHLAARFAERLMHGCCTIVVRLLSEKCSDAQVIKYSNR